jgi:hypothetical protein
MPCWPELATSDAVAAKQFYSRLFGWTHRDDPGAPGMIYTTLSKDGQGVAALYQLEPKMMPPGTPPHWTIYFSVNDVDAAAAQVKANGGTVMAGPMNVMEHGRMAVCADPLGAMFCLWQPKQNIGVSRVQEPGAMSWVQLNAADPGDAAMFYQAVLGWTHRRNPMPQGGDYILWMAGDETAGGGMPMPSGVIAPAHWLIYWGSADVDADAAKAKSLGGQVMVPPTDIPGMARFAVLADPQGAAFTVVKFAR